MSIRQGILALLDEGATYGYQLRADFEERTGNTWPLNIGQVYTTLTRLERDGMVRADGADEEGRQRWSITAEGRADLQAWFATPVRSEDRPRNELAIKLALAASTDSVDAAAVLQTQRIDTYRTLQRYTKLKQSDEGTDLGWVLMLEGMIFQAEAEIRWLDYCESYVVAHRHKPKRSSAKASATAPAKERTK